MLSSCLMDLSCRGDSRWSRDSNEAICHSSSSLFAVSFPYYFPSFFASIVGRALSVRFARCVLAAQLLNSFES